MRIWMAVAALWCVIPLTGCEKKPADPPVTPSEPAPKTNDAPPPQASAEQDTSAQIGAAIKTLEGNDAEAKQKAADTLASFGSAASEAVPALAKALNSDDAELQWRAERALGAMGSAAKDATPQLIAALKSENPMVRGYAAHTLGQIGPDAKSAADALAETLSDPDSNVRRAAVKSLLALQLPPDRLVEFMIRALEDKNMDPSVTVPALAALAESGDAGIAALTKALENENARYWACVALASVGPSAKAAVPALVKLTTTEEPEIRMESVMALGEIGPDAKTAVPALLKALDDQQHSVRYSAALALAKIGDASAVEGLEKQVDTDDQFLKMMSVWAIAKLQPDNTTAIDRAVKVLTESLTNSDPGLRAAAARGLLELNLPREKTAPALMALMEDKDPIVRGNVVDALASLGELAVPKLIEALKNEDTESLAVAVIRQMGSKAKEIVPALALELKDDEADHRRESAFALAALGPDAKDATPQLIEAMSDEEMPVRYAAIYALGKIGPAAAAAKDALNKNMESDDKFTKVASVWALLQIQPKDESLNVVAVPLLMGAVEKAEIDRVRFEAATALGNMGPAAEAAVPVLEKAAKDDHSSMVREAAAEALKKIGKGK